MLVRPLIWLNVKLWISGLQNVCCNSKKTTSFRLAIRQPLVAGLNCSVCLSFIASFLWSFTEYDLLTSPRYVGADHYQRIAQEIASGEGFGKALVHIVYFAAVSVPMSIIMAISLAVMLNWKVRGQAIFRTLFYLSSMVPIVASSILWLWLLILVTGWSMVSLVFL